MQEVGGRNLVLDLIEAAVLAGGYSVLVREHPDAARGLGMLQRKWRQRVTALASEIVEGAGRVGQAPFA